MAAPQETQSNFDTRGVNPRVSTQGETRDSPLEKPHRADNPVASRGVTPMNNFFLTSIVFHIGVLLVLVLGFDFSSTMPVIENTNKNDVISAVILGDSAKSRILPKQPASQPRAQRQVTPLPKPKIEPAPQPVKQAEIKKDVIALKKADDKKKLAAQKALEVLKQRNLFANDLLADIKKQSDKQKKIKQKQLQAQFQKTLREQAEQSLRQQLLNEEIKLQGMQSRQSQGEVNKYKALILQAISEHWIVPTQANRKLYCELMIRLAPGGMVLDVQVTRTSGDPSLDSSARSAVLKASPLPVPSDPDAFAAFRQFVLKVKPENILAADGGMGPG
jgi:colicin import membrane protein